MTKPSSPSDFMKQESLDAIAQVVKESEFNIPFRTPPKVWTPYIPDTNSMVPVSDFGHNNIYISGVDEADHKSLIEFLKVGDIAVYRFPADMTQPTKSLISHRIVEIGKDKDGRYFKFKGDNNSFKDSQKVRDENIKWASIGVLY